MSRESPTPPVWVARDEATGGYAVIEARRAAVEEITTRYLGGEGIAAIAKVLNGSGIRPWGDEREWSPRRVREILTDEALTGKAPSGEILFPWVISEERFAEISKRLTEPAARTGLLDQITSRVGGCLCPRTD